MIQTENFNFTYNDMSFYSFSTLGKRRIRTKRSQKKTRRRFGQQEKGGNGTTKPYR